MASSSSSSSSSSFHGFLAFAELHHNFVTITYIIKSNSLPFSLKEHHHHLKGLNPHRCICSALPSLALTQESMEERNYKKKKKKKKKKEEEEDGEEHKVQRYDQGVAFQLKFYLKEGKVDDAESYMDMMWLSGVKPDLLSYNLMITINGKANRFSQAQSWFLRLESDESCRPDIVSYRSMIGACGRAGELKEALIYYDRMTQCGFRPSIQNFNTLLNLHRKIERNDDEWKTSVHALLSDMKEFGCTPDSSTLDVIVKVFDRFGKLDDLSNAIALMEAAGWSPIDKCHMILIRAYIRCNLVDKALNEFGLLCSNSSKVVSSGNGTRKEHRPFLKENSPPSLLNRYAYRVRETCGNGHPTSLYPDGIGNDHNIIVKDASNMASQSQLDEALCHSLICMCKASGRYEDGIRVYEGMRRSGTFPSWRTSCTVIDICGRMGDEKGVEKGRALFEEMRATSPSLCESTDAGAYTVTINMYLKAGLVEKAVEISDMVEGHEGLILDPALFLAMLRTYSRANMHRKAVNVYKRMLKCKLTWSASMFNGVIHCCGRALPLEEIIKVFLAMVHAKMPLSSVTCNLMMDIFAKAGLLEKSENVFKLAREQNVLNAISYNTIIDAYGKYKEFNKMDHALVEMQNSGFKDHVEAYNSMLDAYGKAGQVRKMENILERMRRADCPPDLSTFNILINVYGREGLLTELQEVRNDMDSAGIKPSNYTFNTLIHAYGNLEMPNEAMDAFKEMQSLGLVPDEITYNCLIAAFEKSGNHLEAARWSLWMTQLGIH